jgi:hypothetical protein
VKIECKLINPITLQLKRPMLSPVEEAEFYIIGVKSFRKDVAAILGLGIVLGMTIACVIVILSSGAHH